MKKLIVKLMVLALAQSSLVMSMYNPKASVCKGGACGMRKKQPIRRGFVPAVTQKYVPAAKPAAPVRAVAAPVAEAPSDKISDLLDVYVNISTNADNMPRDKFIFEIVPVMDEVLNLVGPFIDESGRLNQSVDPIFAKRGINFGIFRAQRDSFVEELNALPKDQAVAQDKENKAQADQANQEDLDVAAALAESEALAASLKDIKPDVEKKRDGEDKEDKETKEKVEDLNNTDLMAAMAKAVNLAAAQAQVQRLAQEEKERNEQVEQARLAQEDAKAEADAIALSIELDLKQAEEKAQEKARLAAAQKAREEGIANQARIEEEIKRAHDELSRQKQEEARARLAADQKAKDEEARIRAESEQFSLRRQGEEKLRLAREAEEKAKQEADAKRQKIADAAQARLAQPSQKPLKPSGIEISGGYDTAKPAQEPVVAQADSKEKNEKSDNQSFLRRMRNRVFGSSSVEKSVVAPVVQQQSKVQEPIFVVVQADAKKQEETMNNLKQSATDIILRENMNASIQDSEEKPTLAQKETSSSRVSRFVRGALSSLANMFTSSSSSSQADQTTASAKPAVQETVVAKADTKDQENKEAAEAMASDVANFFAGLKPNNVTVSSSSASVAAPAASVVTVATETPVVAAQVDAKKQEETVESGLSLQDYIARAVTALAQEKDKSE